MQHAAPHVLATLDRVHTPGRAGAAVAEARAAGFEHVSLDLIYGTPGERPEDWALTLETALAAGPDHVSAYGLEVEPGTALAARVRRGELPVPDGDAMADRQAEADAAFAAAGLRWYEVANHAASAAARCRHNLGYWHSHDWWGIGPGAHSHLDGTRWWNVKHPSAYARRLAAGDAPMASSEVLGPEMRRFERIMLEVRLAEGLDTALLSEAGRAAAERLARDGALELRGDRATLTLHGRLTADAVVRDLTD
jgi:oxygen-independent coproporphyrinogen-3 oxidase